jgi:glycosyltransferase involved in cell wall biosynthesis
MLRYPTYKFMANFSRPVLRPLSNNSESTKAQRFGRKRILYLQFTDPGGYPPLEHSSRILAARMWDVLFLGITAPNDHGIEFPTNARIRVKFLRGRSSGWRQKFQYALYFMWALYWTLRWRPLWIYASDSLSCPIALLIQKLVHVRVVYHEHDTPDPEDLQSPFMKVVLVCRKELGRNAALCVLPQAKRLQCFVEATKRTRLTLCVWNCPGRSEIQCHEPSKARPLTLYYHGSIIRDRLPPSIIVAATRFKRDLRIRITGYETAGGLGYVQELMSLAAKLGAPELVEASNALSRAKLLPIASAADVGWCAVPRLRGDFNCHHMVGASNKVFEYMACGLPLLVSNLPDWISTFVEPGYGLACDPDDPDSIESALQWFLDHPVERREMGQKGRDKIRTEWNYENMFTNVLGEIESD